MLEHAVISMGADRSPERVALNAIYEERRQEAFSILREAEADARFTIAQMRLLHPHLAAPAEALRAASGTYNYAKRQDQQAGRQSALDAYEAAARRILDRT